MIMCENLDCLQVATNGQAKEYGSVQFVQKNTQYGSG